MQLTETFVHQVTPPVPASDGKGSQVFYRDSDVPGFGLRVASGGAKSWILERRIRGKVKRITLGRCDQISLEQAKSRAIKLNKQIQRENSYRSSKGKIVAEDINLQDTFDEYRVAHPALSSHTLEDYQRSMRGPLVDWLRNPIRELKETDILDKHRSFSGKSEARCNNAMRLLRAILNYARLHLINGHHKPIMASNPVDILSREQLWYPVQNTLSVKLIQPGDINSWWQATLQLRNKTSGYYLQLLLLTGLPHAVLSTLRCNDIDMTNQVIRLHGGQTTSLTYNFPVTRQHLKLVNNIAQNYTDENSFVFPGLKKDSPLSDPRTAIKRIKMLSAVPFGINDLHRTFIYLAEQTGARQEELQLMENIFKGKSPDLTVTQVQSLRRIQSGVYERITELIS